MLVGKRDANHCLIIGISAYQNIRPLPSSVTNDASSIQDLISSSSLGLYPDENVKCLIDAEANGSAIRGELVRLAEQCTTDSTVLIFYSGHGGQLASGPAAGEYLLPVDTKYNSDDELVATSISSAEFSEALRKVKARRVVVIFDCCHSGGIGQPKDIATAIMKSGLTERYYQELASGWGRVILASSRENEPSWVRPGDSNSLFTRHLLDGLKGNALASGNFVRILDLFSYLQPKVTGEQPNQHPVLKAEIETNFPIAWVENPSITQEKGEVLPSSDFVYDVFISYRRVPEDRAWVRKVLVPALKAEGLRVCLDDIDFGLGKPILLEMERAVIESRYTLAVFSPDYLESGFTELENIMAQHLTGETKKVRFIGLIYRECPLDLRFRTILSLDMQDEFEFEDNIKRIAKACREP